MSVLFTIIISTFNAEESILNTLKSIKQLNYTNFELIIIDGKSSDRTIEKAKSFSFDNYKVVSEIDNGIYDAWNKGILLSKGDWIIFLGSGDIIKSFALDEYAKIISENKNIDYIIAKAILFNKHSDLKVIGRNWNWSDFSIRMRICHVGSAHSKNMFIEKGMFDEKYKIAGDYDFLLRFGKYLKVAYCDKVLFKMLDGGISNSGTKVFIENFQAQRSNGIHFLKALTNYFFCVGVYFSNKVLNR